MVVQVATNVNLATQSIYRVPANIAVTCHVRSERERERDTSYSSFLSLYPAVDDSGQLTPRPVRFNPGNDPVLIRRVAM